MKRVIKIAPTGIPSAVFSAGSRVLFESVRSFFEDEDKRRAYEKWLETPEGRASELIKSKGGEKE